MPAKPKREGVIVGFRVVERLQHLYERLDNLSIEFSPGTRLLLTILASEVFDQDYLERGLAECKPEGKRLRALTALDRASIHRSFGQIQKVCICDRESSEFCDGGEIVARRYHREDDEYALHLDPANIARLHIRRIVRESKPRVASCELQVASRNLQLEQAQLATPHLLITTEESEKKQSGRADQAYELFAENFRHCTGVPYMHRAADFVQLARIRKHLGIDARASPPDWQRAVVNYFATPQGHHTLADLCSRYPTFRLHALDRFKQPIRGEKTNGTYHERRDDDKRETTVRRLVPRAYKPNQ